MSGASKILIVDDEPNVRLVFRTALEASGYDVTEAADGELALEALEAGPVDLIFLDLRMPGMDGLEVLRRLRDLGNHTPVVIVTAHGDVPNAVQAMKLGAIDFLSKPLSPELLRKIALEVLSRHAHRLSPATRPTGLRANHVLPHNSPSTSARPSEPSTIASSTRLRFTSNRPSASTITPPRSTT